MPRACVGTDLQTCTWWHMLVSGLGTDLWTYTWWGVLELDQTCAHIRDRAGLCRNRPADMYVMTRGYDGTDLPTCSWCLVLVSEQTCRHVIVSHPTSSYLLKSTIYCLSRWWEGTCGHVVIIITWLPVLLCQAAKVQELQHSWAEWRPLWNTRPVGGGTQWFLCQDIELNYILKYFLICLNYFPPGANV